MIPDEWRDAFLTNLSAVKTLAGQVAPEFEARRRALEREGASLLLKMKRGLPIDNEIAAWLNRARVLANELRARQVDPPGFLVDAIDERLNDALDALASSPWTWITVGVAVLLAPTLFDRGES